MFAWLEFAIKNFANATNMAATYKWMLIKRGTQPTVDQQQRICYRFKIWAMSDWKENKLQQIYM